MSSSDTYHSLCQLSSSDDDDDSELIRRHRSMANRSNSDLKMDDMNMQSLSSAHHELELEDSSCTDDQPLLSSYNELCERNISKDSQAVTYTAEEALDHLGMGRFQLKMILICGLFSATDALEMMLLSVLSPELRCEWLLDDWQVALITTIVFVGMFAGSNMWGAFADVHGRRPILLIAACWIGYFGILTSQSPNYIWIVVLRGLVGFGFGGAIQSFTLLSEYLPMKYRAKVLIIYNVLWATGSSCEILMAYWIIPRAGWRVLVLFSALPMIITLICSYTLPESLRFLLAAGQHEKALAVLKTVASSNGTTMPRGTFVPDAVVPRGRYRDMLSPEYFRTVILLWLMWFGVACVYYGIILAQSEILEMGGVCGSKENNGDLCHCKRHSWSDYVSMIISTFGEFAAIPLNLLAVDRIGRKWTLGINFLGAALFCMLAQICTTELALLTMFFFGIRSCISGVFNIIYIYTVEVLPTTVRSIGLGSCSGAARLGALITPFVAQVLLTYSVRMGLLVYVTICLICTVAAYLLPIETKGRALKQTHTSHDAR